MNPDRFEQHLKNEIHLMTQIALFEDVVGGDSINHQSEFSVPIKNGSIVNDMSDDITASLIADNKSATAILRSREDCVLCGTAWVEKIFELIAEESDEAAITIDWHFQDGDKVSANSIICELKGNARQLLSGERAAMNFLQSLSATASVTAKYVAALDNKACKLLDTRKTLPGMRFGQKYAVTCGGGQNHRIGLSDAFLIKENHIMACGGIANALRKAKESHPNKLLEIEVENLEELEQAINGGAQIVMLDNFDNDKILSAITIRDELAESLDINPKLEASGNVNLETIKAIGQTGVDYISVGALTKDIKAIDLSMRIDMA